VSDCTSIHFLKLDTDNVCGILGKGGMFDVVQFGSWSPARSGSAASSGTPASPSSASSRPCACTASRIPEKGGNNAWNLRA
jgi:hypothetical protein